MFAFIWNKNEYIISMVNLHSHADFLKQILFSWVSLLRLFCRESLGPKYKQNMCYPSTSGSLYKLKLE